MPLASIVADTSPTHGIIRNEYAPKISTAHSASLLCPWGAGTVLHVHASDYYNELKEDGHKADKERQLIRTKWEISRLRKEEKELGHLTQDRKDDLEFMLSEKKYLQKILMEMKK